MALFDDFSTLGNRKPAEAMQRVAMAQQAGVPLPPRRGLQMLQQGLAPAYAGQMAGPMSASGRGADREHLMAMVQRQRAEEQARLAALDAARRGRNLPDGLPPGLYAPVQLGAAQPGYMPRQWAQGETQADVNRQLAAGVHRPNTPQSGIEQIFNAG